MKKIKKNKETDAIMEEVFRAYREYLETTNVDDLEIDEEQYKKFIEVVKYFRKVTKESNGEMEPLELNPLDISGGLSAKFIVFNIYREQIKELQSILDYVSALTIDVEKKDKVCISICVPNVFRFKEIF